MKKVLIIISALFLLTSCADENSVSSTSQVTEDGRKILSVGTTNGYYDALFSDTLNMPQDIEINFINYLSDDELALEKAVISGDVPDILCLPVNDMRRMIDSGVMADLFTLMDEYDGLKRDDFTDMAIDGLAVNGKMPAIMENYTICTAFAKTKFVGREYSNWTAENAMYFYSTIPENMQFCRVYGDMDFADYMLELEGMNCIDTVNNTCDFGGAFADLLGFCKNNPIQYDTYISEPDDFSGMNDSELVYTLKINGFNSSLAYNTYFSMNKDDITFVGYPSEDGQGAYVTPWRQTLFGISEQCENKELAWDILCRMLKHHKKLEKYANDDTIGVPTLRDELRKDYDRNESYENSINTAMYLPDGKEKEYLPTEIKEMLYEYICSVPANPYKKTDDLAFIIDEEAEKCIIGGNSAETAVNALNNRIKIYLSEKSSAD